MKSTIPRSPKLLENLQPHLRRIVLDTPEGDTTGAIFTMPQDRAIPFIRRLTKGLLYTFYPSYDYFPDYFTVDYRLPTVEAVAVIKGLAQNLSSVSKGQDVFRVWHGITVDTGDAGAWIYLFYEAVCFICFHGKNDQYRQEFPPNYEEHRTLPSAL